jgi:beta-N-acetylhexosaminidase
MNRKAIIFGIKGYKLTNKEKILFRKFKPWGIILFSRNIKNIEQLKSLVNEIKRILNDKKYPILIDEEGGNVTRLKKIIDLSYFSQNYFSEIYKEDKRLFYKFYKIYINQLCNIFKSVGININTVPVLDVRRKNSHKIIGTRSFSTNSKVVSELGNVCINLYNKNKIATVIKHIPGHGMTKSDSHYKTPITTLSKLKLRNKDFVPFKNSKSFFAMTAHVIFKKYDKFFTATHSSKIIKEVIRGHINFKGILISDDISMKSLKYKLEKNAIFSLKAGCNLVLHCNGNINEMIKLAKVVPKIDIFTQKKTSQFYKFLM